MPGALDKAWDPLRLQFLLNNVPSITIETLYVRLPCYFFPSRTFLTTSCQAATPSLWKQCAYNQAATCRGGVEQSREEEGEMAYSLFMLHAKIT